MYCGYVTHVKNIRPAENADKLNLCEVFGNTVVVDKTVNENELYIYFPCDGQLSLDFCLKNNLLRKLPDGTPSTGYMDPNKRNIVAIKLRGNKSDGIVLPLKCLESFGDVSALNDGDRIDTFNGHLICEKYIPRRNHSSRYASGSKNYKKKKENIAPFFAEHVDTEQLNYNLDVFKPGDEIEITLKMHGTSHRVGYLPVLKGYKDSWSCRVGNAFRHHLNKFGYRYEDVHDGEPIYEYDYIAGTRRVILENYEGGYYGSDTFRKQHSDFFNGKLWKGETVYGEIVGFLEDGRPIMPSCNNSRLNDKDFIKKYGDETVFSYGCDPAGYDHEVWNNEEKMRTLPQSDFYVYRMTMTNPEGEVIEYTPDFMRYRCEQMGAKCVPVMWKGIIPEHPGSEADPTITAGEWIKNVAERFYDGPDPIGKTHVREGVVVRILNRPRFVSLKHKNFEFKCLSGIAIAQLEENGADNISEDMLSEM